MSALLIGLEALERLTDPVPIAFDQAIMVAVLGLLVNLASAWLLAGGSAVGHHHHGHDHAHDPHRHDHNLRGAYLHVLADALTSLLAIVALLVGRFLGWVSIDPLVGLVAALVIARWSWGLMRDTGAVLLDAAGDTNLARDIRATIEAEHGDRISDLHVWRVGPGRYAAIVALVSADARDPEVYKARLAHLKALAHVTVEIHVCPGGHAHV